MLRGLKTLTAINLFLLMLFAMALTDFVLIIILQKSHVSADADRASLMVRALSYSLDDFFPETETGPSVKKKKKLDQMLLEAGFSCALIIHHQHPPVFLNELFCPSAQELKTVTETAMKSGEKTIRFFGETWGIFWKQPQSMIVSEPSFRNELLIGSVGVVFPLEKTYQTLRNSQKSIIIYILINAAILSCVGLYRIAKIFFVQVRS